MVLFGNAERFFFLAKANKAREKDAFYLRPARSTKRTPMHAKKSRINVNRAKHQKWIRHKEFTKINSHSEID